MSTETLPPRLEKWTTDDLANHSRTYRTIRDLWWKKRCRWCDHVAPCPTVRYALAVRSGCAPLPPPAADDRRDWASALEEYQQPRRSAARSTPRPHRRR
ncbi:hypothetical protein [Phytomonospora endophytica]|uniref:Uncharacterized protein n=1 Tax=Phytomonospora endophytica TaxID=714109 RepID=A0A841FK56_9ACTN|nr:hypothetical protein [Phytomonospora endophytica]MBB6037711.1 hypothetical protein [Phytomonospora endophytica]